MIVEPDLTNHPKFIQLRSLVGDVAMELLVRLWTHCQQNKRGQFWRGANSDYVEVVCAGRSRRGKLFTALRDCGWIHEREDGIEIHDWDKHNASLIARWKRDVKPAQTPTQPATQNPVQPPDRTGQDWTGKDTRGEDGSTHTSAPRVPSVSEVREWAITVGVNADFAQLKLEQATARGDFMKLPWQENWRAMLERFWKEDRVRWERETKKNAPGNSANGHPPGWLEGDEDCWWTWELGLLESAAAGAWSAGDKKKAARMDAIIALRKGGR